MRKALILCVVAAMVLLTGCGDDDGGEVSDDSEDAASDDADVAGSEDESTDESSGELALGDPCDLVPATHVSELIGKTMRGDLIHVDDGLPGATCQYSGEGPTIAVGLTPDGAGFVDSTLRSSDEEDITELPDLGDGGFRYRDAEVQVKYQGHQLSAQFPRGEGAEEWGIPLVEALIAAMS